MRVAHTLLICTEGASSKNIKTTGQLALALLQRGLKVSILSDVEGENPFEALSSDVSIYSTEPTSFLLPGTTLLSKMLKKILKHDTTIDSVHVVGLNLSTKPLSRICEQHELASVVTVMSTGSFMMDKIPFWQRKSYIKHLDSFKHVVVNSQIMLEQANLLNLDNVVLIKEGVDVNRFKPVLSKRPIRRELDLLEGSTIVCCMADICPENKQLEAIKLCMPLGDILQVLLIGNVKDREYLKEIRKEIRRTAVEPYVVIREAVTNPEDYLKACDVFMLLGGVEDRQSTVLEAQSCGLPVVLEPSNSALTLTNGNKTGIVLYPNNALAKNGVEKLVSDPNFRQGRSLYARPFVKKEHSFNDMMDAYYTLYSKL